MPPPTDDLATLLQRLVAALQGLSAQLKPSPAPAGSSTDAALQQKDQLRKIADIINALLAPSAGSGPQPLGQVNGALGTALGNLLNGKKSAIGIIGALATALLGNVPAGSSVGQILSALTPVAGLGGYAMPIFLAIAAWGALGKMEKFSQGTAPPPQVSK